MINFGAARDKFRNTEVGKFAEKAIDPMGITSRSGDLATKMGMGKYKAKEYDVDAEPFTNTDIADKLSADLKKQREREQNRQFTGADRTQLGRAKQVGAANIGDANQMSSSQLSEAEMMRAAQLNQDQQLEMRAGQQDLIAALQTQSAGGGPSLAAMQMEDARQGNIAQAMALAASQRGLGAGQGLRQIADQSQNANQMAARDAMRGRIAEQLAARQQLQGALSGARAQDIGVASADASLAQQAGLANQAANNQFALTQGAMDQDAAARNQAALNQFALTQGSMDQQAALANQSALNQFTLGQGTLDQETALANMRGGLTFQGQQNNFLDALNRQIAGTEMTKQGSLQDLERMRMQAAMGIEGLNAQAFANHQTATGNFIAGLSGAAATAAKAAAGGA